MQHYKWYFATLATTLYGFEDTSSVAGEGGGGGGSCLPSRYAIDVVQSMHMIYDVSSLPCTGVQCAAAQHFN